MAATASFAAMEDVAADDQKVADDPRMQTIMDRCEDLGLDATVVDSIEQWTTTGLHSDDWRRFIATHVAQLHTLSALPQPELSIGSPAAFQLQLNAILASLSYPPLLAGPYSLSNADSCADVTDFLLSELQAARMLSTEQSASNAADSKQPELQAELVKLAALLQQPVKPNVPAAQLFSALSTSLTSLSASHRSLKAQPLLSASDYTPQQLASLDSVTSALSCSLSARLSRIHSRHTATLHSLSPASTVLDAVAPSEADSQLHVWQAFGVTADMVAVEERGAGVWEERAKGRDGSRHGESGLEGVMDRGGRMDGRSGGGGGGRGGGGKGGGGGRHGKGGKRSSGKDLMDDADEREPLAYMKAAAGEEDDAGEEDEKQPAAVAAAAVSSSGNKKKNRNRGGKRHKKKTVQEMQEQAADDTMEK